MSLQKKLQRTAEAGYQVGFNQACNFFEEAIDNTPGIGPVLKERIMKHVEDQARDIATKNGWTVKSQVD